MANSYPPPRELAIEPAKKKPGGKPKFTVEQVADALERGGNRMAASKLLRCDWHTVQRYCDKYPELEELSLVQERDTAIQAVKNVIDIIYNGDPIERSRASRWFLLNHKAGHEMGFGARKEITGAEGGPIAVQAVNAPPPITTRAEWEKLYGKKVGIASEIKEEGAQ